MSEALLPLSDAPVPLTLPEAVGEAPDGVDLSDAMRVEAEEPAVDDNEDEDVIDYEDGDEEEDVEQEEQEEEEEDKEEDKE